MSAHLFLTILLCIPTVVFASSKLEKTVPIVSMQPEFSAFWKLAKSKPFPEQVQFWDQIIEGPQKKIFDFAVWEKQFRPNWKETKERTLKSRFSFYPNIYDSTIEAFGKLPAVVNQAIINLKDFLPSFRVNFPIYAVVAPNFDAKSALTSADPKSVAMIVAIDSATAENANYKIFLPHELFHAFHAKEKGFINDGVMEGVSIVIPLWEEGLATYISGLINPQVLDSDLLFDEHFKAIKKSDLQWLARRFLEQKNSKVLYPSPSDEFKMWFSVGLKKVREDLPNRLGYFLGLNVIRKVALKYSLSSIVNFTPKAAETHATDALKELAANEEHAL